MLQNRIYRGEIVHKGTAYPREHEAIVDEALWDAVRTKLEANGVERSSRKAQPEIRLVGGILFDANSEAKTPTHAVKKASAKATTCRDGSSPRGAAKTAGAHIPTSGCQQASSGV